MELSTRKNTAYETDVILHDGELCLKTDSNAAIKNAALVVDGQPLALTWAQRDHEWSAHVEDVANATLMIALRAVAPVRDTDGTLLITLAKKPLMAPIRYTLTGAARAIAGRSAWHGPQTLVFAEWTDLRLRLRNDGDAEFPGGPATVTVSPGCSLRGDGIRLPSADGMALRVQLPTLRVGAAADLTIGVRPCDPATDTLTISALTPLSDQPICATFGLEAELPTLKLDLMETENVRFGEQLLVRAVISTGSIRTSAGQLEVKLEPGGRTTVAFGALGAYERRALHVPVAVTDATIDAGQAWLSGRLLDEREAAIATAIAELHIAGQHAATMELHVDEADETAAHTCRIIVRNVGDLALRKLRVTLENRPQLAAVRDSALLDGEPIFELDGSVPIFDLGIPIDVVPIGATRELSVRLRHARGKAVALNASVAIDDNALCVASLDVTMANGGARKKADREHLAAAKANAAPPPPAAAEVPKTDIANDEAHSATPAPQAADASAPTTTVAEDEQPAATAAPEAAPAAESPAGDSSDVAPDPAATLPAEPQTLEERPRLIYNEEIPAATLALAGSANAPLGYHVAAALGLLPHGHTTDSEIGVAALHLAGVAAQSLELAGHSHNLGVYGSSGYGLAPSIAEAVTAFQRARGLAVPTDDLGAMRVIVAVADVEGARSRDVRRWRRAVSAALEKATTIDDLNALLDVALDMEQAA